MAGLFGRYLEKRNSNAYIPWGNWVPPTNGELGRYTPGGMFINEQAALGIAAVYTANTILADAVATMPVRQYRGVGENRKEIDLSPVIAQPYVEITQMDWLTQMQISAGLRGNAYGWIIERDPTTGWPLQVMPVHPDAAKVRRAPDGSIEYRFFNQVIPVDNVLHIRAHSVPGSLQAMSPIETLRATFDSAKSAELYANQFFAQSAMPGGILRVQGQPSPEEARAIATQWAQAHAGITGAHRPAVLPDSIQWQQITISPADAQFLETRAFSRDEIMQLYRIPPHVYGATGTEAGSSRDLETQEVGFVRNALEPWLRRLEVALTSLIPRGQYVEFDRSKRVEADSLKRAQIHTAYRSTGIITIAEARRQIGLPPLPAEYDHVANDPYAPLNSAHNEGATAGGAPDPTVLPDVPDTNPNPNAK